MVAVYVWPLTVTVTDVAVLSTVPCRVGVVSLVLSGFAVEFGPVPPNVRVRVFETVFWFPAASVAFPAATDTLTSPSPVAITLNVYFVSLTFLKSATVPPVTVMSSAVNPVRASLTVTTTGIGEVLVGFGASVLRATGGAMWSNVRGRLSEAVFWFPLVSWATPAGIDTLTVPFPDGVTEKV